MPVYGTSRPPATPQLGNVICWRCGVEFTRSDHTRQDAPCRDCRHVLPKPVGGWLKPKEKPKS